MATDSTGDKLALGSAIAGGAIATALIETLFDKGALTREESRAILDRALRNVSFHNRADGAREAIDTITKLMRGWFSAHGETA
jgi:polyhydroxyalkanoate synthesis regulator phasin